MQQVSYWNPNEQSAYPMLRGRRNADAVVIGGGFSGLTTALWLCRSGLRVVLLEARTLGSGASSRCAGMVSLSNGLLYHRLEQKRGIGVLNAYVQTQQSALRALRELAQDQACEWRDIDAHIVSAAQKDDGALEAEAAAMRRAGVAVGLESATQSPLPASQSIILRDMATLHPAKHLRRMAREGEKLGLKIFEHSRVTALETNLAYTERGSVLAPYLVIATGYPVINTPGWYFLRLVQRQSSLFPLEEAAFEGMYFDAHGQYGLRKLREGALFQLNGGRVGEHARELPTERFAARYAPFLGGTLPTNAYDGIETYSPDGLPYIGAYSKKTPNLFVAAGYAGRGLLGSMMAAQAISAKILGLHDEGYAIYAGARHGMGAEDCKAIVGTASRYVKGLWRVRAPRCPHMGCKLVYHPQTRLWEC
ncbi:MAG: FAD-binding oxidoreductase, partial [Clostridia bacterium]